VPSSRAEPLSPALCPCGRNNWKMTMPAPRGIESTTDACALFVAWK